MCRGDGCCGGFIGILVFVGTIFALGFPWYFVSVDVDVPDTDCAVLLLQSYSRLYCATSSECPDFVTPFCDAADTNWRNLFDTLGLDTTAWKRTFDVTLAMLVISAACSLGVVGGFLTRCCSRYKDRFKWHIACCFGGLASLIFAVIYFAVSYPQSVPDIFCAADVFGGLDCHQFWGSKSYGIVTVVWGPAGWAAAAFTLVFYSFASCLSCQRSADANDYGLLQSAG